MSFVFNYLSLWRNEGFQNELPQNVSLCHVDYFELNSVKVQKTQEELVPPPQLPKRI